MNNLKIFKVGGAALGKLKGWKNFELLIKSIIDPAVIVISALNLTTRQLKNAAVNAEMKDIETAQNQIDDIFEFHHKFAEQVLNSDSMNCFEESMNLIKIKIERLIKGVYLTGCLSAKTLDSILFVGEKLALEMIKCHFDTNKNVEIIDSGNLIITNSNFGKAVPIIDECKLKIQDELVPKILASKIVITQGFSGKTIDGNITTMGIESSNLTATLLADLLDANELHIRTDVAGIFTADPQLFSKVSIIQHLSYIEAKKAAMNGLKLIYADMISIAVKKNIQIYFESGVDESKQSTLIDNSNFPKSSMIIVQKGITIVKISFNTYFERKIVIDNVLNNEKIRANIIHSNLMEDYLQLVLIGNYKTATFNFENSEIINNLDLVKVMFVDNFQNLQKQISKFSDHIYSNYDLIKNDNNYRIIIEEKYTNNLVESILDSF